jgi:hypothetical protein
MRPKTTLEGFWYYQEIRRVQDKKEYISRCLPYYLLQEPRRSLLATEQSCRDGKYTIFSVSSYLYLLCVFVSTSCIYSIYHTPAQAVQWFQMWPLSLWLWMPEWQDQQVVKTTKINQVECSFLELSFHSYLNIKSRQSQNADNTKTRSIPYPFHIILARTSYLPFSIVLHIGLHTDFPQDTTTLATYTTRASRNQFIN